MILKLKIREIEGKPAASGNWTKDKEYHYINVSEIQFTIGAVSYDPDPGIPRPCIYFSVIDNEGNIQILSNEEVIVSNNNEFEDFLKRTSRIENLTLKAQEQVIKTGGSGLIDVPQIRPRH